jgi:hypothetical protein
VNLKDLTGLKGVRNITMRLLTQSGLAPVKLDYISIGPAPYNP